MSRTLLMRTWFAHLVILMTLSVAVLVGPAGCRRGSGPAGGDGVVVTIYPLYDLVQQVAGPGIKVSLLLPPGVSSHGYAPSPADVKALNEAALLVANGGGIDDWIADAYRDRAADGMRLVHLMSLLGNDLGAFGGGGHDHDGHDHAHDHDHDHSGPNPHVWLVPRDVSKLVSQVAIELVRLYPEEAAAIAERETSVQQQLAELAVAYEEAIESVTDRRLITFHDAFDPLAEHYGLEVVATVLNMETHDATPARMQQVRRFIEQDGVRAVFIEPQFDARAAEGLGAGITPRLLDPLGDPGRPGYETYDALMRSNLKNLIEGMRENVRAEGSGG